MRIRDSPAAFIELVILLSLIGSINAADNLYTNASKISFKTGYSISNIITISPIELIAFLIIKEYPATAAIASENDFPTIGIKLSIANLAVLKLLHLL